MANPLKGEVEVKLGSETYKCRLNIDALCRIEDELFAHLNFYRG